MSYIHLDNKGVQSLRRIQSLTIWDSDKRAKLIELSNMSFDVPEVFVVESHSSEYERENFYENYSLISELIMEFRKKYLAEAIVHLIKAYSSCPAIVEYKSEVFKYNCFSNSEKLIFENHGTEYLQNIFSRNDFSLIFNSFSNLSKTRQVVKRESLKDYYFYTMIDLFPIYEATYNLMKYSESDMLDRLPIILESLQV